MSEEKRRNATKYDPVTQRYWGLRNLNVVVAQTPNGMAVKSRHGTIKRARQAVLWWRRRFPGALYAAFGLCGAPRNDYRHGDILDPDDIVWTKVAGSCSECCNNCMPKSLKYRCPIFKGNPVCESVIYSQCLAGVSLKE